VVAAECRIPSRVSIRRLVHALNEVTGILEFDRKKERTRIVDARDIDAGLIAIATVNLAPTRN
jgi:hypothetical protein